MCKTKVVQEVEVSDEMIRMQRARLHISQKELAQRTGMTREQVLAMENAKCKKITETSLKKLATVFGVKVEDLLKKEMR